MKELTINEISMVSGGWGNNWGGSNWDVSGGYWDASSNNDRLDNFWGDSGCSWGGFGDAVGAGAITGGMGAAATGGTMSLGTLTVPSWVGGAVGGGLLGGGAYTFTCL